MMSKADADLGEIGEGDVISRGQTSPNRVAGRSARVPSGVRQDFRTSRLPAALEGTDTLHAALLSCDISTGHGILNDGELDAPF
jgi:hypothetical protein